MIHTFLAATALVAAAPGAPAHVLTGVDTATIEYDTYGVPYVVGSTDRAAYYGLGYATARDRLFQMTYLRLRGEGRLSEFFGVSSIDAGDSSEEYLESDIEARVLGLTRVAEERALHLAMTPSLATEADLLQSYADGINRYIFEMTQANPTIDPLGSGASPDPMFARYGIPLAQDWTPADCILIWLSTMRRFHQSVESESSLLSAVNGLSVGEWRSRLYGSSRTIDYTASIPGQALPSADETALLAWKDQVGAHHLARYSTDDPWAPHFSNGIVVKGSKIDFDTAAQPAGAVLVGMPRIPIGSPSPLYEWSITGATFSVRGSGLPGSPNLLCGTTANPDPANPAFANYVPVTWSMTSNSSDASDLFLIEGIDEVAQTYSLDGSAEPFLVYEDDDILKLINPGTPNAQLVTHPLKYRLTAFGPLVTDVLDLAGSDEYALSFAPLRWNLPNAGKLPFVALHRLYSTSKAGNFINRVRSLYSYPAANMIVADENGRIGYTVAGDFPVRRPVIESGQPGFDATYEFAGILPMLGSSSANDWQGFVPSQFRPRIIDPAVGFIQNANQVCVSSSYPLRNYYGGQDDQERSARLRYLMNQAANSPTGKVPFSSLVGLLGETYRSTPDMVARILDSVSNQSPLPASLTQDDLDLMTELAQWRNSGAEVDDSTITSAALFFMREAVPGTTAGPPLATFVNEVAAKYGARVAGGQNFVAEAVRGIETGARPVVPENEIQVLLHWVRHAYDQLDALDGMTQNGGPDAADLAIFANDYFSAGSAHAPGNDPSNRIGQAARWRDFNAKGRLDPLSSVMADNFIAYPVPAVAPSGAMQGDVRGACYNQLSLCGGRSRTDVEVQTMLAVGQSEKLDSHHVDDQTVHLAFGRLKNAPVRNAGVLSTVEPTNDVITIDVP